MNKLGIYKLNFDCGRMGSLEGIFAAYSDEVKQLIDSGVEVYFGEVLGKHSEVYGSIDESEITFLTDNEEFVRMFVDNDMQSGYNPFNYLDEGWNTDSDDEEE